jgi:hypothetical protein
MSRKERDFMTILSGALGQKRRIHIHVGKVLDTEIDAIKADNDSSKTVVALAQVIDDAILSNYQLWPTILLPTILYTKQIDTHICTAKMKSHERRLEMRIDHDNPVALEGFWLCTPIRLLVL